MSQTEASDTQLRGTNEGSKLKATAWWALPSGYRTITGSFFSINDGYWWTSSAWDTRVWGRYVQYDDTRVGRWSFYKTAGLSFS